MVICWGFFQQEELSHLVHHIVHKYLYQHIATGKVKVGMSNRNEKAEV